MPYIQGSNQQQQSSLPSIQDVYHSPTVFINNVPVALYQNAGQSSAFNGDFAVSPVTITTSTQSKFASNDAAYTANPAAFAMPADAVAQGAIQPNYQGTPPATLTTSTGTITTATFTGTIVSFLSARLDEAARGMWNRTYQTTGVSNPNIMSIWTSLGLSGTFTTDTTPWCMGFVNFTLKECGYRWCSEASAIAIQLNPARWHATSISLNAGQPGDIALWNFNGANHVNFIYTVNNGSYTFCGGNQNGHTPNSNNPSNSTISNSWPGGWTQASNKPGSILVGLWRPTNT